MIAEVKARAVETYKQSEEYQATMFHNRQLITFLGMANLIQELKEKLLITSTEQLEGLSQLQNGYVFYWYPYSIEDFLAGVPAEESKEDEGEEQGEEAVGGEEKTSGDGGDGEETHQGFYQLGFKFINLLYQWILL